MWHHNSNSIFKYAEKVGFGKLYFKINHEIGLYAIIALHNTQRGPALGGCRWIRYTHIDDAIDDAIRLSFGMTYKAAASDLAHGGGKAVIMRPANLTNIDLEQYFKVYAQFINQLNGSYITAADSGTNQKEMDIIAKYTPHVSSTSAIGNPAVFTARGVLRGIEAAVKFKLHKNSLKDLHISIQGIGQVGYLLAEACYRQGASLTIADTQSPLLEQCVKNFKATPVSPDIIHAIPADVFAPCALGGIINSRTIPNIRAPIIAGAANNQLSCPDDGRLLNNAGILYAPDFLINAGGLIHASGKYYQISDQKIEKKIDAIYPKLMAIFEKASTCHQATSDVADSFAMDMIEKTPEKWH